jgi:hypothetical protein
VISLVLVLKAADPMMRAHADDAPIDYSRFRSADEVRQAALSRVAQKIQASTAINIDRSAASDELSTSDQRQAAGQVSIETSPAVAEAATSRPESGLLASRPVAPEIVAATATENPFSRPVIALAERSLDEVRGGFESPDSNLKFSFGIERAVYINGELMARTVMYLQNLGASSGTGSAPQASATANGAAVALGVIQNGPGNNFAAQIGPNMVGTVIQNTLDNQKIQNVTTINASVNSMQVLRSMSVQSAVQSGIIGSLRR